MLPRRSIELTDKQSSNHSAYRPDIDGLRAIAVLAVVAFHAGWLKGGFLGVDIFFVISGYLITSIILRELREGHFSFRRFYERRARRIGPALLVVILACIPAAWFTMTPTELKHFGESVAAQAVFASNILFWRTSGYFGQPSQTIPLLHTWSLAVEEQFYLLFPAVLVVLSKLARWKWLGVTAIVLLGAYGLFYANGHWREIAPFYLLPFRAWELLAGSVIATAWFGNIMVRLRRYSSPIATAGLAAAIIPLAMFNEQTPHPSLLTLIPVLGTALLLAFGESAITSRILSLKPVVAVGLISYSLYLWHVPLFVFARLYSISRLPDIAYAGLIAIAFALAFLTWRFVERPFRDRRLALPIWRPVFAGLGVLAVAGLTLILSGGVPQRVPSYLRGAPPSPGYSVAGVNCMTDRCIVGDVEVPPSIAVVGDSHTGVLAQSLDKALKGTGRSALILATGDMFTEDYPAYYETGDQYRPILQQNKIAIADPRIKTVILSARYTLRIENTPFDNHEGGVELLPNFYDGYTTARKHELIGLVQNAIDNLVRQGKRVILVEPIPEVGWDVPETLTRLALKGQYGTLTTSYDTYLERNALTLTLFRSLAASPNVVSVQTSSAFCNTTMPSRCITQIGNRVLYFDDDHLSVAGADMVVDAIRDAAIKKWGIF